MEAPKILIVDDNKDFADVFCDILRSHNYKSESCYGGEEAIQKVQDNPCDIMFLDIRMPQMDGIETLKEIKRIRPDTTVIMMTGYSVDDMVHKAVEEKASDIVYKPFEIDKILSLIKDSVK